MPKKPREYFLHIDEVTGREEIFSTAPTDRKTLRVWVDGRHEITRTYDIVLTDDPKGKAKARSVVPKGKGWELYAKISEPGSTAWRRRRR